MPAASQLSKLSIASGAFSPTYCRVQLDSRFWSILSVLNLQGRALPFVFSLSQPRYLDKHTPILFVNHFSYFLSCLKYISSLQDQCLIAERKRTLRVSLPAWLPSSTLSVRTSRAVSPRTIKTICKDPLAFRVFLRIFPLSSQALISLLDCLPFRPRHLSHLHSA